LTDNYKMFSSTIQVTLYVHSLLVLNLLIAHYRQYRK